MSLLITALVALAPANDPEPPARKFTATFRKAEDEFSASLEKSVPVWKINSKSGIGGATVTLTGGLAPTKIVIRFSRLRALESFHVQTGSLKMTGRSGRKQAEATYYFDDAGKQLDGPKGATASMSITYLKDGMEVVLTHSKPAKQWQLSWIDAYRR